MTPAFSYGQLVSPPTQAHSQTPNNIKTMTDTKMAPPDADIIALADETRTGEPGRDGYILPISFARAVLAKWGTPAPVSQPVAVPAGMEPVAWIDMEEWPPIRWRKGMVRADVREIDGMALCTASQVQAMLAKGLAPGWQAVPVKCPDEICCAIEREIDSQLAASGIGAPMHRQDGAEVWAEALAAAPQPLEAEVHKELQPEIAALKSDLRSYMLAASAEANLATECMEKRKQDEALIRQLVEALEVTASDVCQVARHKKRDQHGNGDVCPVQARHDEAIAAGRARLEGKP